MSPAAAMSDRKAALAALGQSSALTIALDPETDRVMLSGSMAMIKGLTGMLEERGFVEGSNNRPADFVIERAFVG